MADCVFHDGPSVAGGAIVPPPGRSPEGRLRFIAADGKLGAADGKLGAADGKLGAADGKLGGMGRPLNLSATARD